MHFYTLKHFIVEFKAYLDNFYYIASHSLTYFTTSQLYP